MLPDTGGFGAILEPGVPLGLSVCPEVNRCWSMGGW